MKAKKKGKQKVKMYEKLSEYNENTKTQIFLHLHLCCMFVIYRKESRQNIFGQEEMHNVQKIYHGAFVGKE